ncbi:MAG: hypothetical protein GVY36_20030 [Verrucomicrobia bacterium]|jgi:hypothetical protein|nr:hypothetical protein [Verrucomicrobiota bacterium]
MDELDQFADSYAVSFSGAKMVLQVNQAIGEQDLAALARDLVRVVSKIGAEVHLVVGEFPFDESGPNDDWSSQEQVLWSHRCIHHASARLSEALSKAGLDALYTHPVMIADDGTNVDAISSKFRAVCQKSSIFIWSPMFMRENGSVEEVDPVEFAVDLAATIDATKLVCIQPTGGSLKVGEETVSWIRTDEVEQLVADAKAGSVRGNSPEAQRLIYQNKRALFALRDFVESKPDVRRGHLIGFARRALSAELLTVSGFGTMVSNHALDAIPDEACYKVP